MWSVEVFKDKRQKDILVPLFIELRSRENINVIIGGIKPVKLENTFAEKLSLADSNEMVKVQELRYGDI